MLVSCTNARPRTSIHVLNTTLTTPATATTATTKIPWIPYNSFIILTKSCCPPLNALISTNDTVCTVVFLSDFRCGKRKMNEKFRETVDICVLAAAVVAVAARRYHNCIKMEIIMFTFIRSGMSHCESKCVRVCRLVWRYLQFFTTNPHTNTHTHMCIIIPIPVFCFVLFRFHPYGNSKTKDVRAIVNFRAISGIFLWLFNII